MLRTFRLGVKQGHAWIADDPSGTGDDFAVVLTMQVMAG